jgi:Uma2 family endonuclease
MPAPAPALDETLIAALAERQDRCELVDGEIVAMSPAGFTHGRVITKISRILDEFSESSGSGAVVISGDSGFIWDARNVRAPDVAVVSAADAAQAPESGFVPFSPLIAIEVVSPSDSWNAVHKKAQGWLDHGAKVVWVVDPVDRLVVIHLPDRTTREVRGDATLVADALPGFTCPVAAFFR